MRESGILKEAVASLSNRLRGEVHQDRKHRILYATDASLYQQDPLAIVCPKDAEDVGTSLEVAREAGIPVLPRGAGTSLAGQTTCEGALVLDFSRHMNRLKHLDVEGRSVEVEPGMVLDACNQELAKHGLMLGPDVASGSRATLGGMAGNNSCGAHSLRYGKMSENVEAMDVLLMGGTPLQLSRLDALQLRKRLESEGEEGELYRSLLSTITPRVDEVRRRFPKIPRRVSGLNLDALIPFAEGRECNFARLLVGSEGTLATATALTLRIFERPLARGLAVLPFVDLLSALRAAPWVSGQGAVAVEVLDRWLLRLTASSPGYRHCLDFLDEIPGAILMVEFFGSSVEEIGSTLANFAREVARNSVAETTYSFPGDREQALLWTARKSGLGLLMSMKGDAKPIAFVEDTAVPPDRLADYMEEFLELVEREGARCAVYGHAASGCLHTRPVVSVKDAAGRDRLKRISEGVASLVKSYGGCLSGEHGDGLARSRYLKDRFGTEIVAAFRETKRAFDPAGLMNPGKIYYQPAVDENLRWDRVDERAAPSTSFAFSEEGGIVPAVELCNGMGACRSEGAGTMCPSYRATREEEHSTRGRANLLRAALSGKMPGGLASEELHESLALCLACKACKTECPAQVDMSKLKAEALHARVLRDGPILSDRLLGRMDATLRLSARLPGLAHFASRIPGMSSTIRRAVGLDARRPLPSPSVRTFSSQFRGLEARHGGRRVALFVDTFTEYFEPGVGHAAVRLLRHLGFEVELAKLGCCGRTRIARGLLTEARSMARENAANLDALARAGIPVLGLEPSCLLTMRDDYPDLLQEPPSPEAVRNLHVLDEYLLAESSIEPLDLEGKRCLVHPHCHQQALGSGGAAVALLESAGAEARGTEAGCCGMAGAFGYEHYELSRRIAEDRLVPAVESLGPDVSLVASGFSCRQQIRHMTGRTAVHPVALLSRHLR